MKKKSLKGWEHFSWYFGNQQLLMHEEVEETKILTLENYGVF
jgi:hypothetical protein